MKSYTDIVDRLLWPAWEQTIRRRPTPRLLAELRANEQASLEALRDQQTSALRKLLEHALIATRYFAPIIRGSGLEPARATLETLRRLPIMSRADAQASVEDRVSIQPPRPSIRKTTGGTTGEPLVIRYDARSEHWRQAIKLRGFGWAGFRVGAPSLHYWGAPSKATGTAAQIKQRLDRALKREVWLDSNRQDDSAKRAAVAVLLKRQTAFLFAYSQAASDLARFINRNGLRRWPDLRVVGGAEKIYPEDRTELERAFGEVFETYGCREVMLIATECQAHNGMHISMENIIVEIVDDDGEPTKPGKVGRVVITDLHNFGCPFIRYANGDLAIATSDDDACRCGRAHTRLQSVEGRSTETLRDASGAPVGGMVFNLIFSPLAEHVRQFQVVQRSDSSIVVKVIPAGSSLAADARSHLETAAARYLPNLALELELVASIPLSKSGKKRVVIVEEPSSEGSAVQRR